jgi:hypothetical protein
MKMMPKPMPSPHHTALTDLDKQTKKLCHRLCFAVLEPDEKIEVAEAILMLQNDRKVMVKEIMTQLYGSTKS